MKHVIEVVRSMGRIFAFACLALAGAWMAEAFEVGDELLVNGGFEEDTDLKGNSYGYYHQGSSTKAWTGGAYAKNNSAFGDCSGCIAGTYVGIIQGNTYNLQQVFTNTLPCEAHLTFKYKHRTGDNGGTMYISVYIDDVLQGSEITVPGDKTTRTADIDLSLEAGEHVLKLAGRVPSGDNSTYFDQFAMTVTKKLVGLAIDPIATQYVTNGTAATPVLAVRNASNGELLQLGRDYTVDYSNNVYSGTATAYATGCGDFAAYGTSSDFTVTECVGADAYAYRMKITPTAGKVTAAVANLPVLVRLSGRRQQGFDPALCGENGSELRFALPDGTLLGHDIDSWVLGLDGDCLVWVNVPLLTADTVIYAYWGLKDGQSACPVVAGSAWPSFPGVWHMSEASTNETNRGYAGAFLDALGGTNAQHTVDTNNACVGRCKYMLSGLTVAEYDSTQYAVNKSFGVSFWFKWPTYSSANWSNLAQKGGWSGGAWYLYMNKSYTQVGINGNQTSFLTVNVSDVRYNWQYVTVSLDGSYFRLYVNGVLKATSGYVGSRSDLINTAANLCFGGYGYMDELRLKKGYPSADWIAADYKTQTDAAFFTYSDAIAQDARFTVAEVPDQYLVAGGCRPKPVVTDLAGNTLTEGTDYSLDYEDVEAAGTAYVRVTGLGAYAGATISRAFTIYQLLYVDAASKTAAEPFGTPETASSNLTLAVAQAKALYAENGGFYEIRVAAGSYKDIGISLDGPYKVVGETGNAADVVFNAADSSRAKRAFTLGHAQACIRNLTITGTGLHADSGKGGHVYMSAGAVENCVITGGYAGWDAGAGHGDGQGGNVYMSGGRLARCVIGEGHSMRASSSMESSYGHGVCAVGGVIDSCLIRANGNTSQKTTYGGGVYASGSTWVVNCTFVGNRMYSTMTGAGIYVNGASVKVVNCLFYDNGGTADLEFGAKNLDRFFHCACSVTNASCATWYTVGEKDFAGYAAKDYSLALTSPLVDTGSTNADWYAADELSSLDLVGAPRISGKAIDPGCYEIDQSIVSCGGSPDSHTLHEGSNVTFRVTAFGGSGTYLYKWDYGNGVTGTTAKAVSTYAYPDAGLFTVRVAVSDDDGATWSDWYTDPTRVVTATKTMYVNPKSENPTFPYKTPETASKTFSAVLNTLTNNVSAGKTCVDGVTIVLAKGTITEIGMTLSSGVTVMGETGDPADVVVSASDSARSKCAFTLTHADAAIRDLTISGTGRHADYGYGGHVNMSAGTVEHCVITGGYAGWDAGAGHGWGQGGNVYMSGGRLLRSVIGEGHSMRANSSMESSYGHGVCAVGGVIDSCLIRGNGNTSQKTTYGGGVYASGSTVIANCTFVGNRMYSTMTGAGIYVNGTSVKVVNSIFYDNGDSADMEFGAKNLACFHHCASSVTNDSCATWQLMDETDFSDYAAKIYSLQFDSPLVDGGSRDEAWYPADAVTNDLAGAARVSGGEIDLGCYEVDQSRVSCSGSTDVTQALEENEIAFHAVAVGTKDAVLFRWDHGNGVTNTTSSGDITYAYPAAGLFTVRLSASADGGTTWCDWTVLSTKIVIAPETMYVNPSSANPTFPYKTPETAAKTILTALMTLTNTVSAGKTYVDGVTIVLAKGTITETGLTISSGVTIRGETGDPADVIVSADDSARSKRAFTLTHAGAAIRDLTITGKGLHADSGKGGHVYMSAGTVENCVITGGYAGWNAGAGHGDGQGGNVYMSGGRLVRSIIGEGHSMNANSSMENSYGHGVCAVGGVIDSCLIRGNGNTSQKTTYGGGVYASGSTVIVNCTFVKNRMYSTMTGAGIYVNGTSVKVVNSIFYDNGDSADMEFGAKNLDRFSHCACTVTNASCATWYPFEETDFSDYTAGQYSLQFDSALVDAGTRDSEWYPENATTNDLAGLARVSGGEIDIGCYEVDQSHVSCSGALDAYAAHEDEGIVCRAFATGTKGAVTFRWDFGNGVTNTTTDGVYTYAYPAAGLYTVRVSASADGGKTWCDWFELTTKPVVAPETMYVNPSSANPTFPYKTPETASTTIRAALLTLTNTVSAGKTCVDGITIVLAKGTITETGLTISSGVTIRGETGDPADVIINDNVQNKHAFTLNHSGATLRDLTISGRGLCWSSSSYSGYGGHVSMSDGLIDHCVIKDGYAHGGLGGGHGDGHGGNVYMSGGRLVRSQILNGVAITDKAGWEISYGAGVCAVGGVVENCLICGNGSTGGWCYGGGVYVSGSTVIANCTVVGNKNNATYGGAGIYVGSAAAKVVNCIFYDNGGTTDLEFGNANLGRFFHCASSVTNESCETWRMMDETDFAGYAAKDYTLAFTSPLVDAGSTDGEWYPEGLSDCDLVGRSRVSGTAIDLGCYEVDQSKVVCGGAPESHTLLEGSNVTFYVTAFGGNGTYRYKWDFGNGTVRETDATEYTYAYPDAGLYTVRVAASDDDGDTWSDWTTDPTRVVIAAKVMYVNPKSETPVFPYKTPETASKTILATLMTLTNNVSAGKTCVDGVTVILAKGTITETGLTLSSGVTVRGETGEPADVIIIDNVQNKHAFKIEHADAAIRDLTISGRGLYWSSSSYTGYGGHVQMSAGTIDNCIVKGGYAHGQLGGGHGDGQGGNVYMSGGRLVRSQILNGVAITDKAGWEISHGAGVCAVGGVVENCLIRGNGSTGGWTYGGGVYAGGNARILGCTIIENKNNSTYGGAGVYVGSANAKVVNCIILNNGDTPNLEFGSVNLDRYAYCAGRMTNEVCETWYNIDESVFRDYAHSATDASGLRPASMFDGSNNPIVSVGPTWAEYAAEGAVSDCDLLGGPRPVRDRLDIGAIESRLSGLIMRIR